MPTFHDRRSGETEETPSRLEGLYGSHDLERMFPEGTPKTPVPWAQAGKRKHQQMYDPEIVHRELSRPIEKHGLVQVDPRRLLATQPNLTRPGVAHYMGNQWRTTGQTFADQNKVGNRYPFVYARHRDGDVEEILLAGHHRAAAALLRGEPLEARRVEGGWGPAR